LRRSTQRAFSVAKAGKLSACLSAARALDPPLADLVSSAGSSACTVFAALTGRSPVGNSYLAGIDEPTARFLQTVALETVQDYYRK
jgi:hypothetical protein